MSKKLSINARFRQFWNENHPDCLCWVTDDPEQEFRPFNNMWEESGTDMKQTEWLRFHQLNDYKLDFVLEDYPLCVEIDGQKHLMPSIVQKDRKKSNDLQIQLNYTVLRYPADTVVSSMSYVEDQILECLEKNFDLIL